MKLAPLPRLHLPYSISNDTRKVSKAFKSLFYCLLPDVVCGLFVLCSVGCEAYAGIHGGEVRGRTATKVGRLSR